MKMSEYTPIDCELHDEFEAAIIQKQALAVELLIDEQWKLAEITPLDLLTEAGQEFLVFCFSSEKERRKVRLDKIRLQKLSAELS